MESGDVYDSIVISAPCELAPVLEVTSNPRGARS